ncbi:signal peptidase I [Arthrobacter crystallopoietes]|uniref:signal peptidase I n=1 Tax=Crystallibacter crystallopoietes TaxID=37928 RepID=UPI003D1F9FAB
MSTAFQDQQHTSRVGLNTSGLRVAKRALSVCTTVLLVLTVALFLLLAIGPRVFGYQTATMLTGSMSPMISPGDVVVTVPVDSSELKVGDVVTYHIPVQDHRVETHRIVDITREDGGTVIQTKGDANEGIDPWKATLEGQVVHRHAFTIPHLGAVIRTLREPAVRNTLMYGAPALLVAGMLVNIWRKPKDEDAAEAASAGTAQTALAADAAPEPTRHG